MLPNETDKDFLVQDPQRQAWVLSQLDRKGANICCLPKCQTQHSFFMCLILVSPKGKLKLGDVSDVPRGKG